MAVLPWLIAGLLLLGGLALLLMRRRRRAVLREERHYQEPTPRVAAEPLMAAPLAAGAGAAGLAGGMPAEAAADEPKVLRRGVEQPAGFAAGLAAAPGPGPAAAGDRPALDLTMRPLRAGVSDEDARVEFELAVGNNGTATARDIRISAWMFPAGSESSDMERTLMEHGTETTLAEVDAGDIRRIESSVALPTAGLEQDSVLPVVVTEARYRLADGSEKRTSARFAVGVPVGEQLAHFDLENPSGLHEDVEARPLETT
jgi:hypothetical protein